MIWIKHGRRRRNTKEIIAILSKEINLTKIKIKDLTFNSMKILIKFSFEKT